MKIDLLQAVKGLQGLGLYHVLVLQVVAVVVAVEPTRPQLAALWLRLHPHAVPVQGADATLDAHG